MKVKRKKMNKPRKSTTEACKIAAMKREMSRKFYYSMGGVKVRRFRHGFVEGEDTTKVESRTKRFNKKVSP